jgi:hypothetical protein
MELNRDRVDNIDTKPKLVNNIGKTFIIAWKESTQELEEFLQKEGFDWEVIRQEDKQENNHNFARSYLCMINHSRAWERAIEQNQPTLIVEADFVPVLGFGQLPLPYNPDRQDIGIAWLYTCASQLYSISKSGYAQGYSTAAVAYIINSNSAKYLLEMIAEIKTNLPPDRYCTWDSNIDKFLRAKNLKNYIPFRNYGEHGGIPNPEHRRQGLSTTHRADVLYGKLAFCPLYASGKLGKYLTYLSVRLYGRLKGMARLITGKFLRCRVIKGSSVPCWLISFSLRRHLSIHL